MGVKEVTFYSVFCDRCKEGYEGGEFTAWGEESHAIDDAVEYADWFARWVPNGKLTSNGYPAHDLAELICPGCQKCEVCGSDDAYEANDHLVCQGHEDHDFSREKAS